MPETPIKEHMEVIGADGVHIGTVDRVENGRIKLTKADSGEGSHKGHHHFIDLSLVPMLKAERFGPWCERCSRVTMEKSSLQSRCDGGRLGRRPLAPRGNVGPLLITGLLRKSGGGYK